MKRILMSVMTVALVGGATFAASGAFFSDTETAAGNTLEAGSIDLKVDNTCYYRGQACVGGVFEGTNISCNCTWGPEDLTDEHLFFDLVDIKPGDWEEDTISLTVENNEAWLCADVQLTSDDDVDCTEPEEAADPSCGNPDPEPDGDDADGELADLTEFLWWADDGDNVLENDETFLPSGPLGVLDVGQTANVTLADSLSNIWGLQGPIPQGGGTFYIGKAWCYGIITPDAVAADRGTAGDLTDDDNGPNTPTNAGDLTEVTPEDGGFNCDGSGVGNESQSDKLTADIGFRAEQARNNDGFVCEGPAEPPEQT